VKEITIQAGRAVVSTQGHDKGRAFVVVKVLDERYVLLSDGDTRKLERPKKKQLKHLRVAPHTFPEALSSQLIRAGAANAAIRKALSTIDRPTAGADRITNKEEYALVQE
jgi:ribosomal protein L14E/L6E/L27E